MGKKTTTYNSEQLLKEKSISREKRRFQIPSEISYVLSYNENQVSSISQHSFKIYHILKCRPGINTSITTSKEIAQKVVQTRIVWYSFVTTGTEILFDLIQK